MENVSIYFGNGVKITAERMGASEIVALTQPAPAPVPAPVVNRPRAMDTHDNYRVARCIIDKGDRILAIKFIRAQLDLGLKEAKDWVDNNFPR